MCCYWYWLDCFISSTASSVTQTNKGWMVNYEMMTSCILIVSRVRQLKMFLNWVISYKLWGSRGNEVKGIWTEITVIMLFVLKSSKYISGFLDVPNKSNSEPNFTVKYAYVESLDPKLNTLMMGPTQSWVVNLPPNVGWSKEKNVKWFK